MNIHGLLPNFRSKKERIFTMKTGKEGKEGEKKDQGEGKEMVPAVPPSDYSGTIADWVFELASRGYHPQGKFYGDIMLSLEDYNSVLDNCERKK